MEIPWRVRDLTGQTFGCYKVLEYSGLSKRGKALWKVVCLNCGYSRVVWGSSLTSNPYNRCRSCSKIVHGHAKEHNVSSTHNTWVQMKQRCSNPNHIAYHRYGGRGIKVCKGWLDSFNAFIEDMGERPGELTLDRIDNDKGYYKENCRWVTREQQANNRGRRGILKKWITT